MPVQQQNSSFAARLGGRVAGANEASLGKPIDLGNRRLPGGIRLGVAKLSAMYTKTQENDSGMVPKGEIFFRASASVVWPTEHEGMKIAGLTTTQIIPLCDIPAKGQRKASSFDDNYKKMRDLIMSLGIGECPETRVTDPTGRKTEAYWFAAMKTLCDPARPPVYIEFSTRSWTPAATPQQPKPEEMVFETWHGRASEETIALMNSQYDAGGGVTETPEAPPTETPTNVHPRAVPSDNGDGGESTPDLEEEVAAMVAIATEDPDGNTEEGVYARKRLEDLAWEAGWTKEHTKDAPDWAAVGEMALTQGGADMAPPYKNRETAAASDEPEVKVGSHWLFSKRDKNGNKLKDGKGKDFPPQEVEVVTVNKQDETCTLKYVKSGLDVVDIRSKAPIKVKWEWLEELPF